MKINAKIIYCYKENKYEDFEIGIVCKNIIPPMSKTSTSMDEYELITSYNYACKTSYVYNIKKHEYLIGDEEIDFAKGVLKGFHEYLGETIEEAVAKVTEEVKNWIDKIKK